ncbi:hypothetical protein ACVWZ3_000389 [Bradyrhizobium sp. i1.3.6]
MNENIIDAAKRHFASDYFEARQKFRDYFGEARVGEPAVYTSPARGPRGEELSTDVAWFGDPARLKRGSYDIGDAWR